ncbi:nitroreductase family protein [Algimonas porphyrae]|uniref:nitroreductase family protein n=1 Tax=Algimonas porphyrae TaxID=1128113 RepID=UPI003670E3D7
MIDFLATRRSNLAKSMAEPGPDADTLKAILTTGTRVPDHRKLAPFRLQVFQGDARARFGDALAAAYRADYPDHPEERWQFEAHRFLRAPTVIAVISAPKDCVRGTPIWEQQLSAGSVCLMLCLAAQAHGFGAQWLTEWYAYDSRIQAELGMCDGEQVAGFVYIGTPIQAASPRARPDPDEIITHVNDAADIG